MFNITRLRCVSMSVRSTLCGRLMYPANQSITQRNLSQSDLPPDLDYEELLEELKKGQVKLIDVRTPEEIAELGCVAGSISLPLQSLGDDLTMNPEKFMIKLGFPKPTEKDVLITMCMGGVRARTAQLAFIGAGYENVRIYKGSFEDWTEKGGEVVFTK